MSGKTEPRILYVLVQGAGGLPHYTAELANAVTEHAEVHLMAPKETTADDVVSNAVYTHPVFEPMQLSMVNILSGDVPIGETLRGMYSYRQFDLVDSIDPDVVHFTAPLDIAPHAKLFCRWSGIDRRYPVVETFHDVHRRGLLRRGRDLDPSESLGTVTVYNTQQLLDRLIPSIDRRHSIVHTESNKNTLVENGTRTDRISVIPHGVYEFFKGYGGTQPEEEHSVLYFGNVVESKGPDTAIRAIPHVREHVPDVKFVLAGSGSLSEECWELIETYDESFEIHNEFIPNESVGGFFQRAQVIVIPHRRQNGHSGTLTIAYSFGKPVVTTTVGDYPRLVRDTGAGLTVGPDDPEALANAIVTLLKNRLVRETMAENSRTMANKLSWEHVASRHLDVYRELQ